MDSTTRLSTTLIASRKPNKTVYYIIIITAVIVVTVITVVELLPLLGSSLSSVETFYIYSSKNLTFSYPQSWTILNLTGPHFQTFLTGGTQVFSGISSNTTELASLINNGSAPSLNFALVGISYSSSTRTNFSYTSLPQNIKYLLGTSTEVTVTNISIIGCSGLQFRASNVARSILSPSMALQLPNVFLFTVIGCINRTYELEAEAAGQKFVSELTVAYPTIETTIK